MELKKRDHPDKSELGFGTFSQIVWRRPNQLPIRHNLYTTALQQQPDIVPVLQHCSIV